MIEAALERLVGWVKDLTRRVERLEAVETTSAGWVILPQASRLTSTAWNGNARSTTSATLIDMSAAFGAPANIDAYVLRVTINDSGSAGGFPYIRFDNVAPDNTSPVVRCSGMANDSKVDSYPTISANADGDIYFDCAASGVGTLDVTVIVLGYHLR